MTMIGAKNLMAMAKMWQRLARRKRITLPRPCDDQEANNNMEKNKYCKRALLSSKAEKGHFVVYTSDSRRFVLPLAYLDNAIFRELLKLAEEEFGLPRNAPITLPFNSVFVDYLVWLIQRNVSVDVLEKALMLTSAEPTSNGRCLSLSTYPCLHAQEVEHIINPHFVIQGF